MHPRTAGLIAALLLGLTGCGIGELAGEEDLPGQATSDDPLADPTPVEVEEDLGPELDLELDLPDQDLEGRLPAATPPFRLYLSHAGKDSADGRSPEAPLATLSGAQARLRAYLPVIDRPVEIRIAHDAGKAYQGQEVVWSHSSPDHTISFMPSDYQKGRRLADLAGRPLFDGKSLCQSKTTETAQNAGQHCRFFVTDGKSKAASRLRFYYLHIRHYTTTGIGLHNDGEGRNLIYGCRFERLGNLYFPAHRAGYTAIGISSSDHNQVRNNRFVDIRNKAADNRFMHAVYMNRGSSHNTIAYNNVLRVSGDPIKVRHYSNRNLVEHNSFRLTGVAAFLDWPEGGGVECFSWENIFRHNIINCGYDGRAIPTSKLRSEPEPGAGTALCVRFGERVRKSGNANTCP